ncbi:MAG: hypothetical protein ACOX7D_02560 [Alphaproteobacteria bacterium]|jgi:hypothetical protein|nr:helix-turn-helix domain-containing protein [Alphaproteobacteria bacterium]
MFNGITFWTNDKIWRKILSDLGAKFTQRDFADVVFNPDKKFSPLELNTEILKLANIHESKIINKVCGTNISLSDAQKKIIITLYKCKENGISAEDLQLQLGYAPKATTNAVGTAIYQLRKIFGKEFIKNKGGKYKL